MIRSLLYKYCFCKQSKKKDCLLRLGSSLPGNVKKLLMCCQRRKFLDYFFFRGTVFIFPDYICRGYNTPHHTKLFIIRSEVQQRYMLPELQNDQCVWDFYCYVSLYNILCCALCNMVEYFFLHLFGYFIKFVLTNLCFFFPRQFVGRNISNIILKKK